MPRAVFVILAALLPLLVIPGGAGARRERNLAVDRRAPFAGVRGTYSAEPRTVGGRLDVQRLVDELVEIDANTYNFLVLRNDSDWADLKRFLPAARERGIDVWVTLAPPSKPSGSSMPWGLNFERWAKEIARLSREEPNLVAWGIDDFSHNADFFSRDRLRKILETSRDINPWLAFVPTVYYKHAIERRFVEQYDGLFDAMLFPYRAESSGLGNLADPTRVAMEIQHLRSLYGRRLPIVLDVYASRHSRMGDSTPEYVRRVMSVGSKYADGVIVFRHQAPGTEKWEVVKELFRQWAK